MLMIICPACDGEGTRFIPRRGGNDPDGRTVRCECDDGEVAAICDGCDATAIAEHDGLAWCGACLAEPVGDV